MLCSLYCFFQLLIIVLGSRQFLSVEDLQAKVFAFIEYYNRTMAKPFKCTYQVKALMA